MKLDPKVVDIKHRFILNSEGPWSEADVRALIGQIDILNCRIADLEFKSAPRCQGCGGILHHACDIDVGYHTGFCD